jgi:hypothetical protein
LDEKEDSLRWLKIIADARIAKGQALAKAATAQDAWDCKKGSGALSVSLVAAESVKIAGGG